MAYPYKLLLEMIEYIIMRKSSENVIAFHGMADSDGTKNNLSSPYCEKDMLDKYDFLATLVLSLREILLQFSFASYERCIVGKFCVGRHHI